MPHITSVDIDLHQGVFKGEVHFEPGLNLIAGENGTMKSLLLQQIKGGRGKSSGEGAPRMMAVSPKRNSERRRALDALQHYRRQNRTYDTLINERMGAAINTTGFDAYPSFSEIFYLDFERRCRDGTVPAVEHMEALTAELNSVVSSIFDTHEVIAAWDDERGTPLIHIKKRGAVEIPIESLSTGEEELLSLAAVLYIALDKTDVYLIDEPEVHLNWHLEDRLFAYLDDLCERHGKQAIVVTHSRAMFKPRLQKKTTFLSWTDAATIRWSRDLTAEQYRRIAGDAIEVIGLGDFARPTFFVEDAAHTDLIEGLARILGVDVTISECGNSSNVRSLFRLSQQESGWENSYFLTDGDNQGDPFPGERHFVHLPVYCSDNYLIDPGILAEIAGISVGEAQQLIHGQILAQRDQILRKNKFFEFLLDGLEAEHLTFDRLARLDASLIVDGVARALGKTTKQLADEILGLLAEQGRLEGYLPPELVAAFSRYRLEADEAVDGVVEQGESADPTAAL